MHIKTRNVNTAFQNLLSRFESNTDIHTFDSRNGKVARFVEPVMVSYEHPKERVLLNPVRDANPFFHLYESLWMLSGRNDLKPLLTYVSNFGKYSDDNKTLNGAYGYRWRNGRSVDQLETIIDHLQRVPNSRRAVVQMWNVEDDLLKIDESKDVCCNLSIVFEILYDRLHMTVFNRSNDVLFGMLGANAVHFSILQEYIACSLGIPVGTYNQVTSNLHLYMETWKDFKESSVEYGSKIKCWPILFENKEKFDEECSALIDNLSCKVTTPFLKNVAQPMFLAHDVWKRNKDHEVAFSFCNDIQSHDWRYAAYIWLTKRVKRHFIK
jgi:thymidylate synthase